MANVKPGDFVSYEVIDGKGFIKGEGTVSAIAFEEVSFFVDVSTGGIEFEADHVVPFDHVLIDVECGDQYEIIK